MVAVQASDAAGVEEDPTLDFCEVEKLQDKLRKLDDDCCQDQIFIQKGYDQLKESCKRGKGMSKSVIVYKNLADCRS